MHLASNKYIPATELRNAFLLLQNDHLHFATRIDRINVFQIQFPCLRNAFLVLPMIV